MTNAIQVFNKLSPRMKALYLTSLVVSVALMAFGAILLTSASIGGGGPSSISSGSNTFGGRNDDLFGSEYDDDVITIIGNNDGGNSVDDTLVPTQSSASPTTPFPLKPLIDTPTPSKAPSKSGNLRPTNPNMKKPSVSPMVEKTTKPSTQDSSSPSWHPSTSPTDPAVVTDIPTVSPIVVTDTPTKSPVLPTHVPSSSMLPTLSTAPTTSFAPTPAPLFPTHAEPINPRSTYFNYNRAKEDARFGPNSWGNVTILNSTENYWSEFGFVENQCNKDEVAQSPIDVCAKPVRHCEEHHEFRSKV